MKFHAYCIQTGEHIANVTDETYEAARASIEKVMEGEAQKFPFVLVMVEDEA